MFDIDGCLALHNFNDGKHGFRVDSKEGKEAWDEFLINENAYDEFEIPKMMQAYIEILRKEGDAVIYFLSQDDSSMAYRAKRSFLKKNYGLTDDAYLVMSPREKGDIIELIAKKENVDLKDCILYDDSWRHLTYGASKGIEVHHIAEFLLLTEVVDISAPQK